MNQEQEQFFNFIIARVQDGKEEAAKSLLNESFTAQAESRFNSEYLQDFIPHMMTLLKPEYHSEVEEIMQQFGKKLEN